MADRGSERFDVCVVGAGPAGSAAACRLAAEGIRTVLVDRDRFPRDKVCGDGIAPRAVRVLEDLGLDPETMFPGCFRIAGVRVTSPARRVLEVRLEGDPEVSPGYVIPRRIFDAALLEEARRRGVTLRDGLVVRRIREEGEGLRIGGVVDGRPVSFRARVVIGAWGGRGGRLTKVYPPAGHGDRFLVVAVRAYYGGLSDLTSFMEIHFDPGLVPGYGWVFPLGTDRANIGYGMRLDCLRRKGIPLRRLFSRFLVENPFVAGYLETGEADSPPRGAVIPLRRVGLPLYRGRVLLAGDAAGLADPLNGEGIGTAMRSGWLAAGTAAEFLQGGWRARGAFRRYAARCRRELTVDLAIGGWVQSLLVRPPLTSTEGLLDAFVEKAHASPRMARAMGRMIIGDMPRAAFLRPEAWKKLWKAWRGRLEP